MRLLMLLLLLAQVLCLKLRPCSLSPPVGCVRRVRGTAAAVGAAIGATTGAAAIVSTAARIAACKGNPLLSFCL